MTPLGKIQYLFDRMNKRKFLSLWVGVPLTIALTSLFFQPDRFLPILNTGMILSTLAFIGIMIYVYVLHYRAEFLYLPEKDKREYMYLKLKIYHHDKDEFHSWMSSLPPLERTDFVGYMFYLYNKIDQTDAPFDGSLKDLLEYITSYDTDE